MFAPGQTAIQDSRYEDAIPIFERVVTEYGGTSVALEATIGLANACFQTGDFEKARTYYQTLPGRIRQAGRAFLAGRTLGTGRV